MLDQKQRFFSNLLEVYICLNYKNDDMSVTFENSPNRFALEHPTLVPLWEILTEEYLLKNGKRVRPKLVEVWGTIFSLDMDVIRTLCRGVEFAHAATLAHDDVLDQATTRRGKKTLNVMTSEAIAILSGDLLLARVVVELSGLENIRVLQRMSLAVQELVEGEWLQLELKKNQNPTVQLLDLIAEKKTASLIRFACVSPCLVAQQNDPKNMRIYHRCESYLEALGVSLGRIFQWVDDVLDFSEESGKDFAKDFKEGLWNQVMLATFEFSPPEQQRKLLKSFAQKNVSALAGVQIDAGKNAVMARVSIELDRCNYYLKSIESELTSIGIKKTSEFQLMRSYIEKLGKRER